MPALRTRHTLTTTLEPPPETMLEAKVIPALPSISEILEMLDPKLRGLHC
jgi:hypothetical protein